MNEADSVSPTPSVPHSTGKSFAGALRAAFREHGDVAALRDAVCSYVDEARGRREPVERVIIDLKQEMRAAGVVDRYLRRDTSPLAAQRLGSQVVPMAPLPVGLPDTRRRQIKCPTSARVALVVSSLDAGGAERVISIMANHWAERGWDVAVITIGSAARDFYALDPRVTRTALGADDCSDGIREAIANNAHRIKRLRAAIRDANPDAVISFLTSTNVLALIAGTLARVPVIVSERIDPTEEPAPTAWKALRRVAYPRAHAVVVQTPEVRAWAEAFPTRDG